MPYDPQFTPDKVEEHIKNWEDDDLIWKKPFYLQKIRELIEPIDLSKFHNPSEQEVKVAENLCIKKLLIAIRKYNFNSSSHTNKIIQENDITLLCTILCKFLNPIKSASKKTKGIMKKVNDLTHSQTRPEAD